MSKVSAFRSLLYALSRIPGLSFLRSGASAVAQAERTQRNVESAKKAAGAMKDEVKKEKPKEEAAEEEAKEESGEEKKEES